MLPLEVRKYLFDIQEACELLARFTQGKSLDDYVAEDNPIEMVTSIFERQRAAAPLREVLQHHPDHQSFVPQGRFGPGFGRLRTGSLVRGNRLGSQRCAEPCYGDSNDQDRLGKLVFHDVEFCFDPAGIGRPAAGARTAEGRGRNGSPGRAAPSRGSGDYTTG